MINGQREPRIRVPPIKLKSKNAEKLNEFSNNLDVGYTLETLLWVNPSPEAPAGDHQG